MAIPAHLLAKEKGRNVTKWTILALIPLVNFACICPSLEASDWLSLPQLAGLGQ
eukprot:gene35475-43740_t